MTREHNFGHLRAFDQPHRSEPSGMFVVNIRSVESTYTPEAFALFLAHPDWDLSELERQCNVRGLRCHR